MERLSKHLSYSEAIHSDTAAREGIDNIPTGGQLINLQLLSINIFESVREYFNVPIYVSSMFRSEELNEALKGADNSQHMANSGAAMDLDADRYGRISNKHIFDFIKDNLEFDQLIAEYEEGGQPKWIHCSYNKGANRKEVFIAVRGKGYLPYTSKLYNEIYGE